MISRTTLAAFSALLMAAPATAVAARDAYVADAPAGEVAQLAVDASGALTPLVPASLEAALPRRLTMTPDGKSLYVTAGYPGHGRVLQYDVSASGTASAKDPAALSAGRLPVAVAMHPTGGVLYVADRWGSQVLSYAVAPGGGLERRGSLSLPDSPAGIAVAPHGRSAYVIVDRRITRVAVAAGGELVADSLVALATGDDLTDVTLTPDGRYLYATSEDSRIFQFRVGADGLLSRMTPAAMPVTRDTKLGTIAVSPDGGSLYAAGRSREDEDDDDDEDEDEHYSGRLFQFTVGPDGGLVAKDPPGLVVPRARLADLALTPNGRTLYAAGGDLHLFNVDSSGRATPKAPLFNMFGAVGVAVSPNQAPVASFDAHVPPVGNVVLFDASSAADPDGSITRYDWDFGDGQQLANGGPNPSHHYAQPGEYEVRLVVTDNEGASTRTVFTGTSTIENGAPSAQAVRIIRITAAAAPQPQPPSAPTQVPQPELGETVIVERLEGRVLVRLPGQQSFVSVETLRVLPVGSLVDTRRGKALLRSVRDRSGRIQQGRFFAGLFKVRQRRSQRYITEVVLRGRVGPCPRAGRAAAAQRSRRRKLWGNAKGRFRTQGRYSSSAVRGTRWLTQDSCEGTLTVVRRGRVAVRDLVRDTTTVLEAGERYLARPR